MQQEQDFRQQDSDEKEIDLLELASKLWAQRKKIIIWCVCGAILGLIIAFSIPREYTTTVKLAPEISDSKSSAGNLGALASMAGLSTGASAGADAVYPQLYPDVVSSVPFATSLFDVVVTTNKDGEKFTVAQYLEDETKSPWWSFILGLPGKIIGLVTSKDEEEDPNHKIDNFRLTKQEDKLVKTLTERVTASVDQKTNVITINVKMQDPLVSAELADTVVAHLSEYITDYRTNKARKDLAYAEALNEQARADYYKAQQAYADYLDRNQGLAFRSAQTVSERLQNEASLAFGLYNQTAQQVQKYQAKVQETTPVYTIVNPPTVPINPSAPRKALILIGFTFLAFVACAAWILFLSPMLEEYKVKSAQIANDNNK
ncbi:MAG: chain-length determining protein [Bacteroides sp.]|nr:chain-length determining protein [Bacteroides sp.]